jgi:hypothetical protein
MQILRKQKKFFSPTVFVFGKVIPPKNLTKYKANIKREIPF